MYNWFDDESEAHECAYKWAKIYDIKDCIIKLELCDKPKDGEFSHGNIKYNKNLNEAFIKLYKYPTEYKIDRDVVERHKSRKFVAPTIERVSQEQIIISFMQWLKKSNNM